MADVPSPKQCESYHPGHDVHWIPALRHANHPEEHGLDRAGRVVAIDGEVLTVSFDAGGVERFRNHDTPRLQALLDHVGSDRVIVTGRYSLLHVPSPGGKYCVNVARDTGEPLGPCLTDPLDSYEPEALARRMTTHGGFTAPVARRSGELQ